LAGASAKQLRTAFFVFFKKLMTKRKSPSHGYCGTEKTKKTKPGFYSFFFRGVFRPMHLAVVDFLFILLVLELIAIGMPQELSSQSSESPGGVPNNNIAALGMFISQPAFGSFST
jgi:hypothetical protein